MIRFEERAAMDMETKFIATMMNQTWWDDDYKLAKYLLLFLAER